MFQYISSINGEKGFYIYEVNGKIPTKAINEFVPDKNSNIKLKKLVPVIKKKIKLEIKENKS